MNLARSTQFALRSFTIYILYINEDWTGLANWRTGCDHAIDKTRIDSTVMNKTLFQKHDLLLMWAWPLSPYQFESRMLCSSICKSLRFLAHSNCVNFVTLTRLHGSLFSLVSIWLAVCSTGAKSFCIWNMLPFLAILSAAFFSHGIRAWIYLNDPSFDYEYMWH